MINWLEDQTSKTIGITQYHADLELIGDATMILATDLEMKPICWCLFISGTVMGQYPARPFTEVKQLASEQLVYCLKAVTRRLEA